MIALLATTSSTLAAPDGGAVWDGEAFAADPQAVALQVARLGAAPEGQPDVLLQSWTAVFDAEGRPTVTTRMLYVIPPAGPGGWGTARAAYTPSQQVRPTLKARVISPRGEVSWLDQATLSDGPVGRGPDVFSEERALQGPLPALEPGAVVEEEHVLRWTAPFFPAGSVHPFASGEYAIRRLRIRVEAPASLPLQYSTRRLPRPRESRRGGRVVLELVADDVPQVTPGEPYLPLELTASRGFTLSTGRSWAAVARAYSALVDRQLEGARLLDTLRGIVAPGDDVRTASAKVLAWVTAGTRYTGLALGDHGLVPARPAETLERRYGDCKDLSLLVVGLLRAGGHRASLALLRTGRGEVDPALPGLGSFDHAVVRVEAQPPIWLDPAAGAPPGLLGPEAQGRLALVAAAGTAGLVKTPESGPADNRIVITRRVELAEHGPGSAHEELEYVGGFAGWYGPEFRSRPRGAWEKPARGWLEAMEGSAVTWTVEAGQDGGTATRLVSDAEASRWSDTTTDLAEAKVAVHTAFEQLPEPLKERRPSPGEPAPAPREAPLALPMPFRSEVSYRVVPPPGFERQELPPDDRFEIGSASFTASYLALPGGEVAVLLRFEIGRTLAPDQVARLRQAVAERVNGEKPRIRFQRTSKALLDLGKGLEALEELRRLVALHPAEAMHHNHLALALLRLGLGEAARAEARRAVALEPRVEWGHRVLAHVLKHDLLGRAGVEGADLPGALAELRTARDLAPRNALIRSLIAENLVTAEDGERFGSPARVEQALAELRFIHEALKSTEYDEAFARALLVSGRAGEALTVARAARAAPGRNGVLLAAAAAVEGVEGPRREGRKLPPDALADATRRMRFELLQARAYPALVGLFEDDIRAAPGERQDLRALVEVMRHGPPAEAAPFDDRDPAEVTTRAFSALVHRQLPEARELFAAGRFPSGPDPFAGLAVAWRSALAGGANESGLDLRGLLDLFLGALVVRLEPGGPPWRATVGLGPGFAPGGQPPPPPTVVYLLPERGRPRLAAIDPDPDQLGYLALRLAREGDLQGALRLLDWARPTVEAGAMARALARLVTAGERATAPEVASGAAALASTFAPAAPEVFPVLLEAWPRATGELRHLLGHALLLTLREGAGADRAPALADEIGADDPALATRALETGITLAMQTGDFPRAEALGQALEVRTPGPLALRQTARVALHSGRYPEAMERADRLVAAPGATAQDWNLSAWARLFLVGPGPEALQHAERAVKASGGKNAGLLHTQAALQAWSGKPDEALVTLRRVVALEDTVRHEDWLVMGRVAEAYGLPEEAQAAYRRVERPEGATGGTSWELARRRLAALAAARKP